MNMKPLILRTALALMLVPASYTEAQTVLFRSQPEEHVFYRIPAIVSRGNTLWYFTDDRSQVTDATAWGDIGSVGNISILMKQSKDNGRTWQETPVMAVEGKGDHGFDRGHGDAAVVCDRKSGKMLLICASGEVSYGRSRVKVKKETRPDGTTAYALDLSQAQHVGRYYSHDGGRSWKGEDIAESIYSLFDQANETTYTDEGGKVPVTRLFFSSGRICQSALIKAGSAYRIYSVLTTNQGSLVVYSDDFGDSWKPLGGAEARPAPKGDESKVDELPDGSILLSCRMQGGRYFNIFTYTDAEKAEGSWDKPVASTSLEGGTAGQRNATNGEILIVPATDRQGKPVYVALQSIPFGNKGGDSNLEARSHVSIYWKVLESAADYASSSCFETGWTRYEVTDDNSAYSTMVLDGRGDIAFAYEDHSQQIRCGSQMMGMYDMTFRTLSLEEITGGACRYSGKSSHRNAFLKK